MESQLNVVISDGFRGPIKCDNLIKMIKLKLYISKLLINVLIDYFSQTIMD